MVKSLIFALTVAAVAWAAPAVARVGENREQVAARYGQGHRSGDRLRSPGAETWTYTKSGFVIEVVFIEGVSVWEIIHGEVREISNQDIETILKGYDTPATNWRFDKRESRWERGGKPKLVAYRWAGHPDFFCVKDLAACDDARKKGGSAKDL